MERKAVLKTTCLLFSAWILIFTLCLGLSGCSSRIGDINSESIVSEEETESLAEKDESIEEEEEDFFEDSDTIEDSSTAYNKTVINKRLTLQKYTLPGILTVQKPEGWQFYKTGDYNTLGFLTFDEKEPLAQVFLFGEIGIFYTSQEQKSFEKSYQNNGGYSVPWVDMPVVSPFDGKNFFESFYSLMTTSVGNQFRASGNMPVPIGLDRITVISQKQVESPIQGLPCYFVQALLSKDGQSAKALLVACPYSDNFGHGTAYLVAGVSAPIREFETVYPDLCTILNSFSMDPDYVEAGMQVIQQNGEAFRQLSQTLSQTSDIITKGYEARSKTMDIVMEKKSDQIMGVERVYDPASGEVYEVQNGFYDYYDTHRQDYPKTELKPLPDDSYELWSKPPSLNHSFFAPN